MTDISAPTPPPSAAPAPTPAPAANEVPINTNPTNAPQPIGAQTPEKSQPESRRDAIQRAFNRSRDPNAPKPKAAEAKMGHNNPPEETKRETKQPIKTGTDDEGEERLDLRRRPNDQPRVGGKFAPRAQTAAADPNTARPQSSGQPDRNQPRPGAHKQLPDGVPYRDPPQRMAEHAKAEWHAAPESVRGEIHRMHQEFSRAYNNFKGDHETMNSIRQYHELATAHGTTLDKALSNYVGMEQKLRSDPVGGLDMIVNNLNLRTPDGQKITFRDIAYHVLSQTPDQHKALQTQNQTTALSHQLGQLHSQNEALAQKVEQMQYAQQFNYTRNEVDRFADTHPRFDELGDLIEYELKFGHDLETAYRRADLLRPTPAPQTRTPAAQTRNPDKSISGAPDGGPVTTGRRQQRQPGSKAPSRRDAIQDAINRVNGGL
jgi:hypothetical protein